MTFSLLARDAATGQLGLATATHAYGVGPVADHTRPGVGVIATQSFVEVSYGPRGLDLLEQGVPAAEALSKLLAEDEDSDIRQVAYLDTTGSLAEHTGSRCVPSCGSVVDGSVIAIGNMLDNDGVLPAMVEAFGQAGGDLADRLLAGLAAGDAAGGDARGRMSAALRVVSGDRPETAWQGTVADLRVDVDPEPIAAAPREPPLPPGLRHLLRVGVCSGPGHRPRARPRRRPRTGTGRPRGHAGPAR